MTTGRDSVEFSRPIDLARLGDAEAVHDIEATAPEGAALAERLGLIALQALRAKIRVRRIRGATALRLDGHFAADVTQSCIVTLDPVHSHVEEDFTVIYAAETSSDESILGGDADIDWPEPMPEGSLDIGEVVAQQLSLALDPYPRVAGAAVDQRWSGEEDKPTTPFARLAELRKPSRTSG